jgi:stearoyl-CoA desaturase (Delta-9 desaturase)
MQPGPLPVLLFFAAHWLVSVFCQTFFLHRYGAHKMFTMSRGWERFFQLLTYLAQGPSYLNPRGYAILHRQHHAFSDTPNDPHSPTNFRGLVSMMVHTKHRYDAYAYRREEPEARFLGGYPEWPALDRLGQNWGMRIGWGLLYTLYYYHFANAWWLWLLLPVHYVMGPVHGAIVNWCGHKYGYRNFDNGDGSRNTLLFDFVTFGELFQNNHHKFGMSPNFAARWFELDPCYPIIRALAFVGVIDLGPKPQVARYPAHARPAASVAPGGAESLGPTVP